MMLIDDCHTNGFPLLLSLSKSYCNFAQELHVCTFEISPQRFLDLPLFNESKVVVHDFTNALGWDATKPVNNDVIKAINNAPENVIVVIDSLSFWMRTLTQQNCSWQLQNLKSHKGIHCIVTLLHSQLHSPKQIDAISTFADTMLKVSCENKIIETSNFKEQNVVVCEIIHKKQNGKVVLSNEDYTVDPTTLAITITPSIPSERKTILPQESQILHDSEITFDLTLSEQEENQRKKLILPYTKDSSESGRIFFEPDEADLYEDDPDEDLDY